MTSMPSSTWPTGTAGAAAVQGEGALEARSMRKHGMIAVRLMHVDADMCVQHDRTLSSTGF